MSDPVAFNQTFIVAVRKFITALEDLNEFNDRMKADLTLPAAAAAAALIAGRKDLVTADYTNAAAAITQINFTFNSGDPTQKSFLYKML